MKKYLLISLSILVLIIGMCLYKNYSINIYQKDFYYMDTMINVKLYTTSSKADNLFEKIDNTYKKYQDMTNVYNENSELYKINNSSLETDKIKVSDELYDILKISLEHSKINPKFNINMHKIIEVWKKYRDKGEGIPTSKELENAKESINDFTLYDTKEISNTNPSIDLGAVAKGYATKKVAELLKENNIKSYIINAGGNVVVGEAYHKDYFTVGVENPTDTSSLYAKIKVNNKSVVTSGGYLRFYEYNGKKYHHIIDPDTLYPANNMLSVTVVTEDSALADILSTSLFLLEPNDAIKLAESLDNVEAIIYTNDNKILKTKGFSKYE